MKSLETVAADAMQLPKEQRFTLAHRILSSVEPEADATVEAAWDSEIRERIAKYDAGKATTISAAEVFAGLDSRLGR